MFEVDAIDLLAREVLRERTGALVAEACAWTVGLSDRMHHVRRNGRVVAAVQNCLPLLIIQCRMEIHLLI